MDDPHRLARFVAAQEDMYPSVVDELRAGRKVRHWMWFVFPQIAGLGHSAMAREYAITSLDEAVAYLEHPVLGTRLHECADLLLAVRDKTANEILGGIDAMKLRSSMTLFAAAAPADPTFQAVLDQYFDGDPDQETTARLR